MEENKINYVYKTTNLKNGKFYIGVHFGSLDDDYLGSGLSLKLAIKKSGKENFKKEILKICSSRDEAYKLEESLVTIDLVKDKNCYNRCVGGAGPKNMIQSEESTARRRAAREKFKLENPERYAQLCKEQAERAKKLREVNLGRKLTEEHKRKISEGNKGKIHTNETKRKISEGNKGKIVSDESKEKLSKSRIGYKRTKESKLKQSETLKLKIQNGEYSPGLNFLSTGLLTCPYCLHVNNPGVMSRLHFDKCELKNGTEINI